MIRDNFERLTMWQPWFVYNMAAPIPQTRLAFRNKQQQITRMVSQSIQYTFIMLGFLWFFFSFQYILDHSTIARTRYDIRCNFTAENQKSFSLTFTSRKIKGSTVTSSLDTQSHAQTLSTEANAMFGRFTVIGLCFCFHIFKPGPAFFFTIENVIFQISILDNL